MTETLKHCPECGYTKEDALIHWDHHLCKRPITTTFIQPPIPVRCFDWQAYYTDEGEEAGRYGYGETKEAAIKELKQKFDWS